MSTKDMSSEASTGAICLSSHAAECVFFLGTGGGDGCSARVSTIIVSPHWMLQGLAAATSWAGASWLACWRQSKQRSARNRSKTRNNIFFLCYGDRSWCKKERSEKEKKRKLEIPHYGCLPLLASAVSVYIQFFVDSWGPSDLWPLITEISSVYHWVQVTTGKTEEIPWGHIVFRSLKSCLAKLPWPEQFTTKFESIHPWVQKKRTFVPKLKKFPRGFWRYRVHQNGTDR